MNRIWNKLAYINQRRKIKAARLSLDDYLRTNRVSIGSNYIIKGLPRIINNGLIHIGEKFTANSGEYYNEIGGDTLLRLIAFTKQSKIIIGNNVGISNSTVVAWNNITIEDNAMIGGSVKIWDTDFHSLDSCMRLNTSNFEIDVTTKPILIMENSFIGAFSIILKGVTIGRNSIIGASSVVTKSIPDNVIAAGNPCKIIKSI